MTQIIAGVYEIGKEIGAGGGGVVYLGEHQRLHKTVVLKADRRTLKADTDKLRREVDLLKNLSHTYIPQVYDFIQENGVVYTVMDYIEGESLDKRIAEKKLPSQPELIHWACQLLEALQYLHERPPHGILHGDIKPANIMRRPNGDICLIDFNIALALGEDGAVKVGFSRGYASPEHYDADYLPGKQQIRFVAAGNEETQTEKTLFEKSESLRGLSGVGSSADTSTKGILLDARSDIYSLGATLYHLASGSRPPQDARKVKRLGCDICSEEVSAIIQKAMSPLPQERYQSAQEMLSAFRKLHQNDRRTKQYRRHIKIAAVGITGTFLLGGFLAMTGMKQMEARQSALTLAEYSADALAKGNVTEAVRQALRAIPDKTNIWGEPVTAQAQKALTDALWVYDLADGYKALGTVELPSAPFKILFSPTGDYFAAVYAYATAVYKSENLEQIAVLPMQQSALADCIFVNETHLLYAGENGIALYDIEKKANLWIGEEATALSVSADGKIAAAVNRDTEYAMLYRVKDGKSLGRISFYGQHMPVPVNDIFADFQDAVFTLNEDGSLLAVSFAGGGFYIFNTKDSSQDLILYENSEYRYFSGGFCNHILAVTAQSDKESSFTLLDTKREETIASYSSRDVLLLQADEKGIYLASGDAVIKVDTDAMTEQASACLQGTPIIAFAAGEEYTIAAGEDNRFSFFDCAANCMSKEQSDFLCEFTALAGKYALVGSRSEPELRVMERKNIEAQQLLKYDADYMHEEARISGDGRNIMLFGLKSFRIYDNKGSMKAEVGLPDADKIYDQQFYRESDFSYLEVVWYDGTVRKYSASDGKLVEESQGKAPNKDLYEEFETRQYRVASPLHGTPRVYRKDTDVLIGELRSEDYLTYVKEYQNYLLTEYVEATGKRYGVLLNQNLEEIAYLPYLCDATENGLIFDYESGNLRQCQLYSLQDLVALGKHYVEE